MTDHDDDPLRQRLRDWEQVLRLAAKHLGKSSSTDAEIDAEVVWKNPQFRSLTEMASANDTGERKWYDEFGVGHEFDLAAMAEMLNDHDRFCLGCKQFDDGREVYTVALGMDMGILTPAMFETAWKRDEQFQDVLDRYPSRRLADAGAVEWLSRFEAGWPDVGTDRPSAG